MKAISCGFKSRHLHQKETTIFDRRLSFLFVLFTFLFSFFSLLSNCRFQRKDKREEIKEKVALLRKALIYIIIHNVEAFAEDAAGILRMIQRGFVGAATEGDKASKCLWRLRVSQTGRTKQAKQSLFR